jgi:hypothetical protein
MRDNRRQVVTAASTKVRQSRGSQRPLATRLLPNAATKSAQARVPRLGVTGRLRLKVRSGQLLAWGLARMCAGLNAKNARALSEVVHGDLSCDGCAETLDVTAAPNLAVWAGMRAIRPPAWVAVPRGNVRARHALPLRIGERQRGGACGRLLPLVSMKAGQCQAPVSDL